KTATDIMASLELASFSNDWRPPVITCVAETNEGVDQVWEAAKQHREFLQTSGELKQRRKSKVQAELAELVAGMARDNLKAALETPGENQMMLSKVVDHEVDPHSAAETLAKHLFGGAAK
ncbi:MAG TPA: hypothetical protein PKZ32_20075, partial [Candidatus Melainabacteria bacterium]|nr:hypothetical protein [Candidatus Melainabacteria bacterium]